MIPSAREQQLARQLRAAEDELGTLRRHVAQLTEQRDTAQAALAALHQGEESYEDERLVPAPAQWIWQWNRATPAERLSRAEQVIADYERLRRAHEMLLFYGESPNLRAAIHAALNDQPVPAFTVTQTGLPASVECDHEARAEQAEARVAELTAALQPTEDALTRVLHLAEILPADTRAAISTAIGAYPHQLVARWCLREEMEQTEQIGLAAARRAEQAETRIAAAETVLHRYQGCASNTAAALRMEIREALASTAPCASCCPAPDAQP
jgi:prefoldin subunit 5